MGRTPSAKKPTPSARSLSSRISSALASGTSTPSAPSPLQFDFTPRSASTADMPAQKRAFDDAAGPATPGPAGGAVQGKKRTRRGGKAARRGARQSNGGAEDGDDEVEEGQVVEGDFADLFMVDTTPAAVREKDRFIPAAEGETPLKSRAEEEEDMLTAPFAQAELPADGEEVDEAMDSDDALRAFAKEVADTDEDDEGDEEDDLSDEEEDEAATPVQVAPLYDNEEDLQEAIEGRIVDDSSALVTGRYYKEADLTKTCVLCGETGHSSRDCTHSQCFVCGAIDADHEARNCPVALVCSACGSRGHYARDCTVNPGPRSFGSSRCALCSSNNHMTPNCPSHWRVYDTSGPKPPKRKVVLACANCGSTKDHFIDDCLLPRGHPMKYADPSAFNRSALGTSYSSAPYPSSSAAGPAGRRRGGATGKLDRRPQGSGRRGAEEEDDDDDWFASRARGGGSRAGRGGGGGGGGGGGRGTHTHFGEESRGRGYDARSGGGGGGSGYRDRDREYASGGGGGYDSPRDEWRSMYGSAGGGSGRRSGNSSSGQGGGGGKRDRNGGGGGRLLDRISGDSGGGSGGGRNSGRKPRYQGGYV